MMIDHYAMIDHQNQFLRLIIGENWPLNLNWDHKVGYIQGIDGAGEGPSALGFASSILLPEPLIQLPSQNGLVSHWSYFHFLGSG